MWILTELRCSFGVSGAMFTFMNPVENYIKEIRVPCKLEPNERVTTLPFVFESRPSSRVHSAHSPEMMSSSSTFLHPFARRQEIPAVKKQLHREIVYFFGCNKEFSRNKAAEKYYKDLHTVGISGSLENEASRQLYRSSTNCPRQRILLKRRQIERTVVKWQHDICQRETVVYKLLSTLILVLDFSPYVIIGRLNFNSGLEASTIVVTSTAEEKLLISSIVSLQEEKPSSLFPLLFYIARSCNNCQFISTMTLLPYYIKNNLFLLKIYIETDQRCLQVVFYL